MNADGFEHDAQSDDLLTLQNIISRQSLPCLVRLVHEDVNDTADNYCLLLCQTSEPYLLVSNEAERFSIPLTFDGECARGENKLEFLSRVRSSDPTISRQRKAIEI